MLNAVSAKTDPLAAVGPYFRSADIGYGNLEIPLTTSRTATTRKSAAEVKARTQYILKADPAHAKWLDKNGITVVSLANNHTMDYGPTGMREMMKGLDAARVRHFGAGETLAAARRPVVVTLKNGMRVGFISHLSFLTDGAIAKCWPAGTNSPGISGFTVGGATNKAADAKVRSIVETAKSQCDFLIVCLHWGAEKQTIPRPYQVTLGRQFLAQGADLVLGAHPHVLQGAEQIGRKAIFYSLGNFTSPKAGSTAVFRLRFDGNAFLGSDMLPVSYSAGKLTLRKATDTDRDVASFGRLSASLLKSFPSRASTAIMPSLWRR